jgi:hypothetical protein
MRHVPSAQGKTNRLVLLLALALTGALFLLGGRIVSASMFGVWHDAVHVTIFVVLLLVYSSALRWAHWGWIVLGVIVVGGLHELSQTWRGGPAFEVEDFLWNAAGAVLGGCLHLLLKSVWRGRTA